MSASLDHCMAAAARLYGLTQLDVRTGVSGDAIHARAAFAWLAARCGHDVDLAAAFAGETAADMREGRASVEKACAYSAATAETMLDLHLQVEAQARLEARGARPDANLTPTQIAAKIVASDQGAIAMSVAHLRRLATAFLAQEKALAVAAAIEIAYRKETT